MRVLIVLDNLRIGGIARSLMNYLPRISSAAECDLLIFDPTGMEAVPPSVRVLDGDERLRILGMSQREILKHSLPLAMTRGAMVLVSRLLDGDRARSLLFRRLDRLSGYDLAISFSQDVGYKTISTGCNHFVLDRVEAKHKAAFIHCDYENYGGYDPRQEAAFARFDRVVCVSNGCRESFLRKFPALKEKTVVCENFTDTDAIAGKLQKAAFVYGDTTNIVTVCRLGQEKGLFRAAEAMGRLIQKGKKDFLWTVVGDGPERNALEQYVEKNGLSAHVNLVGSTDNPYYYMKNADVFLLPSFHEAAPMVFGECQALGLPIISTETISARELVEQRQLGVVCENSTEGIFHALEALLDSGKKPERLPQQVIAGINQVAEAQLAAFLHSLDEVDEEK